MLKQFAAVLGCLVGILFLISFVLPGRWEVSREMQVNSDNYDLHAVVDDLETWSIWSPWGPATDLTAKVTLGDDHRGVDGTMQWTGQDIGSGTITIRSSDVDRGIVFDLGLRGGSERVRGTITYTPAPSGGTMVRIQLSGDVSSSPIGRYVGMMRGYTTGPDLVDALTRLKRKLERRV